MHVYLVRHGDALSERFDPERPLSDLGRREVTRVARYLMAENKPAVNLIVHSSKKRAAQTAQIIREIFSPKSEVKETSGLDPNDPVEEMSRTIREARESFMVVGHLPYLSRLASRLVLGQEGREIVAFQTGTVAILEQKSSDHWEAVFSISPGQISD